MKEKTPTENKSLHNVKEAPLGIARTEQEAWKEVLGSRVEIKPLPEIVTPEVKRNLDRLELGLRYVPRLELGTIDDLRSKGVDRYLEELQQKYPKWKQLESLTDREVVDHAIPRNLQENYWSRVEYSDIAFPILPGQWMAVETVNMPSSGEKYAI